MRCFVAIDLPTNVKEALAAAQQQLPAKAATLALPKDFHLTLKFLGEITPSQADDVKAALGQVKPGKFSAWLNGVGAFPSLGSARVLWVGVEPENELIALQKQISYALSGDFLEEKGFKPHLTLARVKGITQRSDFVQHMRQLRIDKVQFDVEAFTLKQSTLAKDGAIYEDLGVYTLG